MGLMLWSRKGCIFCLFLNRSVSLLWMYRHTIYNSKEAISRPVFFVLVLMILLFCHICKLNKLYVVKRFCILFKQSFWELIALVWYEVSDHETERWIYFFFWKNLPYDKWIPIKQTKMVAQMVAGFYETSTKKLTYHYNMIQNRRSCVIP